MNELQHQQQNKTSPPGGGAAGAPHHHHHHCASMKYIKGDTQAFKNELKIVKFAEKVDHIPTALLSPPSITSNMATMASKQAVISNDKFYGSPSKMQPPPSTPPPVHSQSNSGSVSGLMSFSDRLKKNSISVSKYELEAPSPLSQSLNGNNNAFGTGCIETQSLINYDSVSHHAATQHNTRCNSTTSNVNSSSSQSQSHPPHQFLFSPMKRLRLEEVTLEKPSFNGEDTLNNTTNMNETTASQPPDSSFAFYSNSGNNTAAQRNNMKTPPNQAWVIQKIINKVTVKSCQ